MASVSDVADCCVKILVALLRFLRGAARHWPAVYETVVYLLAVVSMAYVAAAIVQRFAGFVLAYLHLAAPPSATAASSMSLVQFVVLLFALVFAWLIVFAVQFAAFVFLRHRGARDWARVQLERAGLNPP